MNVLEIAQVAPASAPDAVLAALIAAVVALAGAIGVGVRAGARWLTERTVAMEARADASAAAFLAALDDGREACRAELREISAAFQADVSADREERRHDRDAHTAHANRISAALDVIQRALIDRGVIASGAPATEHDGAGS